MRNLSQTAKSSLFASETSEAWIVLLVLDHSELQAPIRVCSDSVDMTSRGNVYQAFPFRFTMPNDQEESPPSAKLVIDNVDRQIVNAVRTATGDITVSAELVLASDPDTVEVGPIDFVLRDVRYDAFVVEGKLSFDDVLNEPYPGDAFTPTRFGSLF